MKYGGLHRTLQLFKSMDTESQGLQISQIPSLKAASEDDIEFDWSQPQEGRYDLQEEEVLLKKHKVEMKVQKESNKEKDC